MAGRTNRTSDDKREILAKIKEKVSQGSPIGAAIESTGIAKDQYYKWIRTLSGNPYARKSPGPRFKLKRRRGPYKMTLPEVTPTTSPQKLVAFVGNAHDVLDAIRGLL